MRSDSTPGSQAGWVTVATHETNELWTSGKGLSILFGFAVLISILSYVAAADAGLNLLDARESVGIIVQTSIALGTLGALIVSADSISGERERATLESLLVTPVGRRDLVVGKLLASTTVWIATIVVAAPFVVALATGPGVALDAMTVLVVAGGLVAAALTALGLATSAVSLSNRVSLASSVAILLVLAAPSQLPGIRTSSTLGAVLVKANPVSAGLKLANNVVVAQQPWRAQLGYIVSPALAAVVLTALAVAMANRLELGGAR